MGSRMDKYKNNDSNPLEFYGSRTKKNEELYQEIIHNDLEDVNLVSNAHVIGENEGNIDIEKIKELLEKKYTDTPKKARPLSDSYELQEENHENEETKEYNINAILEKAKLDKDVDYERERLKKVHDTQYDILKGLDIEEEKKEEERASNAEKDLMNLINTITEKELTREMNPLDILTDLKGSENTVVLDGVKEEITKNDVHSSVSEKVGAVLKDTVKDEVKKEVDKTFYTNSLSFTKSDFDDFNDLKEDMESNKVVVRILLILVIIALLVGIVFLVNHFFDFHWF